MTASEKPWTPEMPQKRRALARLAERTIPEPNTGCLLWIGSVNRYGYARFYLGKVTTGHRAAWTLLRGSIPTDKVIDHICRVRSCVNVEHMRLVTAAQNTIENSNSRSALNKAKTHCFRGHALSGKNLGRGKKGRYCITCDKANDAVWNAHNLERRRQIRRESARRRREAGCGY